MVTVIPDKLYFKIGEVCKITGVEPYILRYWESEFKLVKPYRTKSNQRLYRKKDVESILKIKKMLYEDKFTIAGAKLKLKDSNIQEKEKQLPLGFVPHKYREVLKEIKEEIQQIRDSLISGVS
ncbi:MAG: MerR family transcriptional regulator [Proteobacteria bacterium]|jgi:DNA-binding transcriptional MerR regulator|nr:MerR family transcriptional regulator [Pseudomonadota bacterium]